MEKVAYSGLIDSSDDENGMIIIKLDRITDEEFNNLLTRCSKMAELRFDDQVISGKILGGSDPTRPMRNKGMEMKPNQHITILTDQQIRRDLENVKAELIVYP